MNVYDFDKTINITDCSTDFYFFCLKKRPAILLNTFGLIPAYILWKLGKKSLTVFKERVFSYLQYIDSPYEYIEEFWDKNIYKSHGWYQEVQQEDDLVISASPEFLIAPACKRLGIKNYIASTVDIQTGKFKGLNCSGEEKVIRFRKIYKNAVVDKFYSDSYSDTPMALLAKESFLVTDGKLSPWDKNKRN